MQMNKRYSALSRTTIGPPKRTTLYLIVFAIYLWTTPCTYALTPETFLLMDGVFQSDEYASEKLGNSSLKSYPKSTAVSVPYNDVQKLNQMSTALGSVALHPSRATTYTTDFSYLERYLDTDDNIISYIDQNFDYKYDVLRPYQPLSPQELNTAKAGDCKDSAVFFGHFASLHGLQGSQITYRYDSSNPTAGHVVNLYYSQQDKESNTLWMHSNGQKYGPIHDENEFYKYAFEALSPAADEAIDFLSFPLNNKGELHLKK